MTSFRADLLALGDCGDFLRWRRVTCIMQWAIDDCGPANDGCHGRNAAGRRIGVSLPLPRIDYDRADDYTAWVDYALACWEDAIDPGMQRAALMQELCAMTEDESSERQAWIWIAPILDSRAVAHIGKLFPRAEPAHPHGEWGLACDCSADRRSYSGRVRGGLMVCPSCLARLTDAAQSPIAKDRGWALELLPQIGWKPGDPLPPIYRTVDPPGSWRRVRSEESK